MTTGNFISGAPRPTAGLVMALAGALLITPDTLLIRLSGLEGWGLTFWRGVLIGGGLCVLWVLFEGRRILSQAKGLSSKPALIIVFANLVNAMAFNFATLETSIAVVVTALATAPMIAAVLGHFILAEKTSRHTWTGFDTCPWRHPVTNSICTFIKNSKNLTYRTTIKNLATLPEPRT